MTTHSTQLKMKLSTDQIKVLADAVATLIVIPVFATVIWTILALIFGLSVTWLQVLGGIILVDLVKYFLFPKN